MPIEAEAKPFRLNRAEPLTSMFESDRLFNQPIDAHEVTRFGRTYIAWDTSKVASFERMFYQASAFNQTIEHWDFSSATNFTQTFQFAAAFNQPLNTHEVTVGGRSYLAWDLAKLVKLDNAFQCASSFNQPLDKWNTSSVTTMKFAFSCASATMAFDQSVDTHEVTEGGQSWVAWNTGSVTNLNGVFSGTQYNSPIGNWDTRKVTTTDQMFQNNTGFNQSLEPQVVNVGTLSYVSW